MAVTSFLDGPSSKKCTKYCNNNKSFSDYRREFSDDDKKPNDHQSAAADSLLEINTNLNKETLTGQPPTSATHFPSSSHLATNRSTIDILKGMYSGYHWKVYECCFMKQNCHFQDGVLQCKIATKPLSSSGIHTTH